MAKSIMIQGTLSSVGKSIITTGLCRIFKQDGYRVAPFKSQSMSGNVFITEDGLQMSKAQAIQAEAAGAVPSPLMNPIFIKPTKEMNAHIIVNGEPRGMGGMRLSDYSVYKKKLAPTIMRSFHALAAKNDIIVIEGAAAPADINIKHNDIVNMWLAKMTDSPVLLVGDIDCGGLFAQIIGTLILLDPDERERVKGTIINKFRGNIGSLSSGLNVLTKKSGKPVLGVLPYLQVDVEDEDDLVRGSVQKPKAKNFEDKAAYNDEQYNILADAMRKYLDIPLIYNVLKGGA